MTAEASNSEDREVEGFPPVPAPQPISLTSKEPSREVERCLDQLDRGTIRAFGAEAMRTTSASIANLRAALHPLGDVPEVPDLEAFASALATFAPDEDAGRRRRTPGEWLRREPPPIDASLDQLEALVRAVPDVSGRRDPGWDMLAAAYIRAMAQVVDLGVIVQAGRIRLSELTGQLATMPKGPEDSADSGTEEPRQHLRLKRDAIERRVHLTRIIRQRTGEYLNQVRNAAALREKLTAELRNLRDSALPEWEHVLLDVTNAAADMSGGRRPIDFSPVIAANGRLRVAVTSTLATAAELGIACGRAEGADPGPFEAIEKVVAGPPGQERGS